MHADSPRVFEANGHSAGLPDTKRATIDAGNSSIAREFQNLITDIGDLMQSTMSLNSGDLARAKAQLHARVAAAKESVQRIGAPLADRTRNSVRSIDGFVREQSWQAAGIAAGASLLIGYLLGRASGRRDSP